MADLNALIAQGAQFAAPINPMEQFAKMQAMQQGQQANQLNQMKMQEYQRGMEETNAMRKLDPSSPSYISDVTRISPEKGFAFAKLQQEAGAAKLKQQTDTSALVDSKLKQSRQFLDNVTTPEQYLAWHEANHADPVLGPVLSSRGITAESARSQIDKALSQPGGFERMLNESKLSVEKFAEMNKPHWVDTGAGMQPVSSLTGQPSAGVAAIPKTATPGELLSNQVGTERNRIAAGQLGVATQRLNAEMATGNLTPATVDFIAETYRQTGTLPPLGMGPMAAAARSKILTRAGELAMGDGKTAEQAASDVKLNKAELAGTTSGQRAVGTQIANVQVAANETNKMINVAQPYVEKVNPTNYPVLNTAGNFIAKNTGDPAIVGLATSLNAIVNTYARAINPKGVATVSDKNHARDILNTAMSKGQLNEAFKVMQQEMGASLASGPETKASMRTVNTPTPAATKGGATVSNW